MKYGFIGLGNMASALVRGLAASSGGRHSLCGYNPTRAKAEKLAADCGLQICNSNVEVAGISDVIVLAVKPHMVEQALAGVAEAAKDKLIISVVAGRPVEFLEGLFPGSPLVRIMPNINAKVGASITGLCYGRHITDEHKTAALDLTNGIGRSMEIDERFAGIFGIIGGAAPAFTFTYINAVANAAVKEGMPKPMALSVAAASALGSAKLILESAEHPSALADQVCSPGGTTIEGVLTLQELGFESAVHKAVLAAIDKGRRL